MSERYDHWINGAWVAPNSGLYLESRSPVDDGLVAEIARGDDFDVAHAAATARAAQPAWAATSPKARSAVLSAIAHAMNEDRDHLVELERSETGKPLNAAIDEIATAVDYFEYYAALIRNFSGDVIDVGENQHIFTRREPYGVVATITPWNVPITQAARSIAPAIAVGNAVVAKPSEYTSLTTVAVARIASEAGLPVGVLNVITGIGPEVGEALVRHPDVRKISFTGSVAAGKKVGAIAAERIVPLTLELGGKSPNIVFADADLDLAATAAVGTIVRNAGQICSAGTRLLVDASVHDELLERMKTITEKVTPGRDIGPIITPDQFDKVRGFLDVAKDEGLEIVVGGHVDESGAEAGFYVPPTIYDHVAPDSRLAKEEVFGPVLSVFAFTSEDEAVKLANDTEYGLVAGIWTRDLARAFRVSAALEAGQVFVNQWYAPIEAPFGGYKQSGHGREKGVETLSDYTQVKSVVMNLT
jgi:aldehyde dehydrogenase (NAD+)